MRKKTQIPALGEYTLCLIGLLRQEGRYSTADKYLSFYRSFGKYLCSAEGPDDLPLDRIDSSTVCGYNDYLKGCSLVMNTVSFYNRIFRAIYNKAARQYGFVGRQPFEEVYTGVAQTRKRAASAREITKVIVAPTHENFRLSLAQDLFTFSYFTRGMAFVDMAYLRKSDIQGGYLYYCRHKTGALMQVRLEGEAQRIISKYSALTRGSRYVFPIIGDSVGEEAYRKYRSALAMNNRYLKEFQRDVPLRLTYYVSRHSWASNAHSMDIPVGVISESLGHTSEKTTGIYLSQLDSVRLDKANRKVVGAVKKMMEQRGL